MFVRQMKYLFEHGYQTISLRDLVSCAKQPTPAKDKKICITFDDGYESVYTHGFGVLQKYNFTVVRTKNPLSKELLEKGGPV